MGVATLATILMQAKRAAKIMTLLGTPWVLAFLMNLVPISAKVWFEFAFIISNTTQGFFVFLFYVCLGEKVSNYWATTLQIRK